MIVNKKIRFGVTDLLLLAGGTAFLIGTRTFMAFCGPKEDGSFMNCHWAGEMLFALALLFTVLAILHLLLPDPGIKTGLDIGMAGLSVLTIFVPGKIIRLCAMDTMICRASAQPRTVFAGIILTLLCLTDLVTQAAACSRDKHSRKAGM